MVNACDVHTHILDLWRDGRGPRQFPARRDVDFKNRTRIAPYLTTVDVLPDGQFRYGQVGSRVITDFGRDPTGTIVGSHVFPSRFAVEICSVYMMVCAVKTPLFTFGQYVRPNGGVQEVCRLLLPLGTSDRRVETVLVSRVARYSNVICGQEIDCLGSSAGQLDRVVGIQGASQLAEVASRWDAGDCAALRCISFPRDVMHRAAV